MRKISGLLICLCLSSWLCGAAASLADEPKFDRIVIDGNFPGGYQVEVADVNGDKKPDIVALGNGTCAWYENPSWKKRIVTTPKETPGIISTATADLDGDGKSEIAIAYEFEMNEPKKGKLLLATQGRTADEPWAIKEIMDVGSIHRLRWADFENDGKPELVIAPIFGPEAKPPDYKDPAMLIALRFKGVVSDGPPFLLDKRPVLHGIRVFQNAQFAAVPADNLGVESILGGPGTFEKKGFRIDSLFPGASGEPPKRGASEIQPGNLKKQGLGFFATIEPWHGDRVAITTVNPGEDNPKASMRISSRTIIDDTLADGHALWVADIDKDGNDEVFAGHRGRDHRVSVYKYDGKAWIKTVIDREIAAQDLRGGDIDGDGKPDVVAIGGATHNVIWYRPR